MIDQLLAELRKTPDDIDRWRVYGDLLLERGDPVGELIALSIDLEREPTGAKAAVVRTWLEGAFPTASVVSEEIVELVRTPVRRTEWMRLTLSMGHVERVDIQLGTRWGRPPNGLDTLPWWTDAIAMLHDLPVPAPAPVLTVELGSRLGQDDILDDLFRDELPFVDVRLAQDDSPLPPLDQVLGACPFLQRLVLMGRPRPGTQPLVHPTLRELRWSPPEMLELRGTPYDVELDRLVADLLEAELPALERLAVTALPDVLEEQLANGFGDRFVAR